MYSSIFAKLMLKVPKKKLKPKYRHETRRWSAFEKFSGLLRLE